MDKNCFFNLNEKEIDKRVEEYMTQCGEKSICDTNNFDGHESIEKLTNSKRDFYRNKVISLLNQEQMLKMSVNLDNRFDRLEKLISDLTETVNKQSKSCKKMDTHIEFIEGTYETLRSPLDFVTSKINRLRGVEEQVNLPEIQNYSKNI